MAVTATPVYRGTYTEWVWVLTAADQIAVPTPNIFYANEKTVDINGVSDANGWNGATGIWEGSLEDPELEHFKLLNTIPDTQDLSFIAVSQPKLFMILPDAAYIRPRISDGTLGATGVRFILCMRGRF